MRQTGQRAWRSESKGQRERGAGDSRPLPLLVELDARVARHALDALERVEILVERDLEDGRAALTRGDGGRGEEVGPDAEPAVAVLGQDLLLVGDPVLVPPEDGGRVVDAEDLQDGMERVG